MIADHETIDIDTINTEYWYLLIVLMYVGLQQWQQGSGMGLLSLEYVRMPSEEHATYG